MKRILLCSLLSTLALLCPSTLRAQFIGYTSPQTVQQKVFNGQNTAATTPLFTLNCTATNGSPCGVQNEGQNVHIITWTTAATTDVFNIRLEGSNDGVSFFSISEDGQTALSGALYASGYYPAVRVNLSSYTGNAAGITVSYVGTSAPLSIATGLLNPGQNLIKTLFFNASGVLPGNGTTFIVNPPCGSSAGTILATYIAGSPPSGNSVTIQGVQAGATTTILNSQAFAASATTQTLSVPGQQIPALRVVWNQVNGGSGLALTYIFSCPAIGSPVSAASLGSAFNVGGIVAEKGARWDVLSAPAVSLQASASRVAGTSGVRHVADCISYSAGAILPAIGTQLTINLRDGATGAGTIIWTKTVTIPATAAPHYDGNFCGLNLIGSLTTAMTLEFSALLTNEFESVTLTGYDVQ